MRTETENQAIQDPPDKVSKFYQNLLSDGYTEKNLGSEDDFRSALSDPTKSAKIYNNLLSDGYTVKNLGGMDQFLNTFTQKNDQSDPPYKSFKTDDGVYDIPEISERDFLKDYPNATQVNSFTVGKDTFDIPVAQTQDFLKDNPQALPLKKNQPSSTYSPPPGKVDDPIELAKQANELSQKTISQPAIGAPVGGFNAPIPNKEAQAQSEKINNQLKENGYDPKQLNQLFGDVPEDWYNMPNFTKDKLLQGLKDNPLGTERYIAATKYQNNLLQSVETLPVDDDAKDAYRNLIVNSGKDVNYSDKRRDNQALVDLTNRTITDPEQREKVLSNIAADKSFSYGQQASSPGAFVTDPLSKNLDSYQIAALNYIQDLSPDKYKGYSAALIDPETIKDNQDALLGREEKLKELEQIGIGLSSNYAKEKLAPIKKEYEGLLNLSQQRQLTPEELSRAKDLEEQGKPLYDVIQRGEDEAQNLLTKYPSAGYLDADSFSQELLGQEHGFLAHTALEAGKATGNTVNGVWNFVKYPFLSDSQKQVNIAETLGNSKMNEHSTSLTQGNQMLQSFKPTLSPELQTDVDKIKNDDSLTYDQKRKQVDYLLMTRPNEWQRTPGGKSNIGISSLMYGVGDLAANLAPFIALEGITGGGATAGLKRKFTSLFTNAAATTFQDTYAHAIEKGEPNPYQYAARVTGINALAMAGADAPGAIRKLAAGQNTAIGDMISKLSDDEILGALRTDPKEFSILKKTFNIGKSAGQTIGQAAQSAGKVTAFTTGGQIINDAIDGKLQKPEDYGKQALVSALNFTIFGTVAGLAGKVNSKVNDVNKAALYTAGKDPQPILDALDQKLKNGAITPADAQQVKSNIEKAQEVFKKVPFVDANGKPLSDQNKRDLLFLKMQENDIGETLKRDIPKELANKLGDRLTDIENQQDNIYKGILSDSNEAAIQEPVNGEKNNIPIQEENLQTQDGEKGVSQENKDILPVSDDIKSKFKKIKDKKNNPTLDQVKISEDDAENKDANSKLTGESEAEQESNVKAIESTAENSNEIGELEKANKRAEQLKNKALDVEVKPASEIHTDESRFQGREKLNEDKVSEISKNWNDAEQDPIHIWTDPKDKKTYVLSGHHRLEAAKRAGIENVKVIDRTNDFTEPQAIQFATEDANANRTMETPLERATTLRKKREKGDSRDDINNFLQREGKNKIQVENLSYLNPKGKAVEAIKLFDKNTDVDTQQRVNKIADWVGEVRKRNPKITDAHENELFDFLMDEDASKRLKTKADFLSKVHSIAGGFDFNPDEPLNIKRFKFYSEGQKAYDEKSNELKDAISERQNKINQLKARFNDPLQPDYVSTESKDYDTVKKVSDDTTAKYNAEIKELQKKLQEHYSEKAKYIRGGSQTLFHEEANSEDLSDMKDVVKSIQDEYADNDKPISLNDIKSIANKELGDDYNEDLVEQAYHAAGKENEPFKEARELQTGVAQRIKTFLGNVFGKDKERSPIILKDTKALLDRAKQLGKGDGIVRFDVDRPGSLDTPEINTKKYKSYRAGGNEYSFADLETNGQKKYAVPVKVLANGNWERISEEHFKAAKKYSQYAYGKPYEGMEVPFKEELNKRKAEYEKYEDKADVIPFTSPVKHEKYEQGELFSEVAEPQTVFMRNLKGEILGFTHEGKIYLNAEHINPNTPIHEAGHIWTEWAKDKSPEIYKRGIELVNGSAYLEKVKSNEFYQKEAGKLPENQREEYLQHEALAMAIGDKGAQFVTEARRKSFTEWAKDLWNKIAAATGFKDVTADQLQKMSFEEFTEKAATDILKVEPLNKAEESLAKRSIKLSEADQIIENGGLTNDNLQSKKDFFNGFPFKPEDFKNIKESLNERLTESTENRQENTGNDGNKNSSNETAPAETKDTEGENNAGTAAEEPATPTDKESLGEIGISHEALNDLAEKIGLPPIERGGTYDIKELADRGRKLLNAGADPNKIMDEFYNSGRTDENGISVIRAKIEQVTKDTNAIEDKNSQAFKDNFDELAKWMHVEKDMGNYAHRLFKAFQGKRDLDTDAFTYLSMAAERKLGRKLTDSERGKIDSMAKEIANLKGKVNEYEERLKNAIDKDFNDTTKQKTGEPKNNSSIAIEAKNLATKIRKAKIHRPDIFSAATPGSIVWDAAVETVAKTIEGGGKLADAISKGIDYIKSTDWYRGLTSDQQTEAENGFINAHRNADGYTLDNLREMFADKKGVKFTREEAKAIWEYGKNEYLNKGFSYVDMLASVANDLGFSMKQINHAIVTPKTKPLSDEMWKKRSELAKNRSNVQRWIGNQGGTIVYKTFKKALNTFREVAVFGHGAIFVGTHAMPTLFDLPRAKYSVKAFLNAYKAAYGNRANYELMVADLKNSENYIKAQRAGLQNNPERIGSDAEIISHHLKWISEAGERGFNAIKILRQQLFDVHYKNLPENLKNDPQVLKEVAQIVNNATGATNYKVPDWMRETMFAGGMEISRWERIVKNPTKAAGILGKIATGKATPADKVFLRIWATRAGTIAGVYTGALIVNNAINAYLYPNDDKKRVNFFNPSKGDWFKFKIGSVVLDPTSGMNTSVRFATTLAMMPLENEKYVRSHNQGDNRKNAIAKRFVQYGLGKLSPGYTTIAEYALKHDYNGNTLPFSDDKPYYKHNRKLGWGEYVSEKLPLPIAEGTEIYNEAAHETGVDKKSWDLYMKGIGYGALSGLTGIRAYENSSAANPKKSKLIF